MYNYELSTKEVSKRTGYSIESIQKLALFFTRYITVFAIKDENGAWFFNERSLGAIMLVKHRIVPNDAEQSKFKALELMYGVNGNISACYYAEKSVK